MPFIFQEWGDPRKEEYYYYMKSYSPVDNVSPVNSAMSAEFFHQYCSSYSSYMVEIHLLHITLGISVNFVPDL